MTPASLRRVVFHPAAVAVFSLAGACLYAAYAALRFGGGKLSNQYLYVVPIVPKDKSVARAGRGAVIRASEPTPRERRRRPRPPKDFECR